MRNSTRLCSATKASTSARPSLPRTGRAILQDFQNGSATTNPESQSNNNDVELNGWLRSIRAHKNVSFLQVSDGTTAETFQAVLKGELANTEGLRLGSSVRLTGKLKESKGRGQTFDFNVQRLEVIGPSQEDYPIQKKHVPADVLRDHAHLRFRTSHFGAIMRLRDGLMREWHDYFEANDYTFVHTPIITSSDCEGAGEAFRVTTDEDIQHMVSSASKPNVEQTQNPNTSRSFFPTPSYLTVSGQLHLEAPMHALSRVYTFSPTFRAEPSATSRHLAEFYMLEAELANTENLDQLMDTVEKGIKASMRSFQSTSTGKRSAKMKAELAVIKDMHLAEERAAGDSPSGISSVDFDKPFARISYTEAVARLQQVHAKDPFVHEPTWGAGLQSEHEKYLAGKVYNGPVFVTDYPQSLKPFYMRLNDDGELAGATPEPTVACFDLLVPDVGELVGGSLREERPEHLQAAIEGANLSKEAYEWYTDLRRYGSVKHGGWGMGWERFICWVTGTPNVKDVVAFPRWKGNCSY